MRVSVDFGLCESNGLCENEAPDVFELDDDDYLQVHTEQPADERLPDVRRAVTACPKQAITLAND
jgi:ferredoxin